MITKTRRKLATLADIKRGAYLLEVSPDGETLWHVHMRERVTGGQGDRVFLEDVSLPVGSKPEQVLAGEIIAAEMRLVQAAA